MSVKNEVDADESAEESKIEQEIEEEYRRGDERIDDKTAQAINGAHGGSVPTDVC